MKQFYRKLITAGLLISAFIFLCGVDACETGYTISGTVKGDADSGVTITLLGDGTDSITTSLDGSYTFAGLDNGTYTVTPSLCGYTFTPVSASVNVSDDEITSIDFTATGDVSGNDTGDERFTDNGDGTITDTLTNLVWLQNADCYGHQSWSTAISSAEGLNDKECGLTDGSIEGDWHLATKDELQRIGTDPPKTWGWGGPAVTWTMPGSPFVYVQSRYYWSSSTGANCTRDAWLMKMDDGYALYDYKTVTHYMWPVRSDN